MEDKGNKMTMNKDVDIWEDNGRITDKGMFSFGGGNIRKWKSVFSYSSYLEAFSKNRNNLFLSTDKLDLKQYDIMMDMEYKRWILEYKDVIKKQLHDALITEIDRSREVVDDLIFKITELEALQ